jgi:hypothetical protein
MTLLHRLVTLIRDGLQWMVEEAWEKINIVATWRELKELGRKYGRRFFIAAVVWELIEDVVFPVISVWAGLPWLVPVFLVLHFEPIVYPIFFFAFRTWDRMQGLEPWSPDRLAESTISRAATKAASYRAISLTVFLVMLASYDLGAGILAAYTLLMTLFSFVHDRIWHDSNFGIDVPTDTVQPKRIVAKVLSYRAVSAMVMAGLFYGLELGMRAVVTYQVTMLIIHTLHEAWWAHQAWGIRKLTA